MLLRKIASIVAINVFCIASTSCQKTKNATQISTTINQLLTAFPSKPSIGILIENLNNKQILYQRNAKRSFVPASTTKTLTATVALNFLEPNYHFITRLSTDAKKVHYGILKGNLYLQFSGDPSLKYKDLQNLLLTLKQLGIKTINGNILIATAPFPPFKQAPGYMWDDFNFCFSAPSDAVVLNRNCFRFTMLPNTTIGTHTQGKRIKIMFKIIILACIFSENLKLFSRRMLLALKLQLFYLPFLLLRIFE